ncbi:MAG: ligase-associated DNA damage response endonuclease PdeM [Flavobacteriaceae bacterium]
MTQEIQINNQHFVLHPTGAIFWQEQSALLVSDVHLGKISHFRKFGAAVPRSAILKNFELLNSCADHFEPKLICFLGDLFHSSLNQEWHYFESWVKSRGEKIILVEGNHDIISPLKYEGIGVRVVAEILLEGFLLTHHPEQREGYFNFSGHVHPAIKLRGRGRQSVRIPCFYRNEKQLVLPAFGTFTGSHVLQPRKSDEVYALIDNGVLKVPV